LPYAFTEHGVVMLSSVLNSERAVQANIAVMRAFVRLRELMVAHKDIAARVEKLEHGQERTASVIEVLVKDIGQLAHKIAEVVHAPAPYTRRRIGYLTGED
jgi:hypothetical protein